MRSPFSRCLERATSAIVQNLKYKRKKKTNPNFAASQHPPERGTRTPFTLSRKSNSSNRRGRFRPQATGEEPAGPEAKPPPGALTPTQKHRFPPDCREKMLLINTPYILRHDGLMGGDMAKSQQPHSQSQPIQVRPVLRRGPKRTSSLFRDALHISKTFHLISAPHTHTHDLHRRDMSLTRSRTRVPSASRSHSLCRVHPFRPSPSPPHQHSSPTLPPQDRERARYAAIRSSTAAESPTARRAQRRVKPNGAASRAQASAPQAQRRARSLPRRLAALA